MKVTLITALALLMACGAALAQTSPYAGQEARPIKALSDEELAGLAQGRGAGFAKAAELNGYPGPMHVIELSDGLALTPEQRGASEALMHGHKARARELGARLIDAERALDRLFAERQADAARVDAATRRVGELHAALRAEHLKAHLEQTALLSPRQIERYQVLRGYAAGAATAPGHAHRH
jgi:Spy/CpxP family protein refolding chaperone